MSSKTKVEDLVTNDKEEEPLQKEQAPHTGFRLFRNRPTPKPQFKWADDPCMPPERNEVIATMREYEGTQSHQTQGSYCSPTEDEISEPEDFHHSGYMSSIHVDQVKAQTVTRL